MLRLESIKELKFFAGLIDKFSSAHLRRYKLSNMLRSVHFPAAGYVGSGDWPNNLVQDLNKEPKSYGPKNQEILCSSSCLSALYGPIGCEYNFWEIIYKGVIR